MHWYHNTIKELNIETVKDKIVGWSLYALSMYVLISIVNEGMIQAGL